MKAILVSVHGGQLDHDPIDVADNVGAVICQDSRSTPSTRVFVYVRINKNREVVFVEADAVYAPMPR